MILPIDTANTIGQPETDPKPSLKDVLISSPDLLNMDLSNHVSIVTKPLEVLKHFATGKPVRIPREILQIVIEFINHCCHECDIIAMPCDHNHLRQIEAVNLVLNSHGEHYLKGGSHD